MWYIGSTSHMVLNSAGLTVNGVAISSSMTVKTKIARWKKDNAPLLTNAYEYKAAPGVPRFGFIAEDVQQVLPEAIIQSPDDPSRPLAIDPMVIIAKHENEIQSLRAELAELRNK